MELRCSGRVECETLGQGGDMWSSRSWRGLRPAGQCLLSLESMDGVREPRNAQLHLVIAKLGTRGSVYHGAERFEGALGQQRA